MSKRLLTIDDGLSSFPLPAICVIKVVLALKVDGTTVILLRF